MKINYPIGQRLASLYASSSTGCHAQHHQNSVHKCFKHRVYIFALVAAFCLPMLLSGVAYSQSSEKSNESAQSEPKQPTPEKLDKLADKHPEGIKESIKEVVKKGVHKPALGHPNHPHSRVIQCRGKNSKDAACFRRRRFDISFSGMVRTLYSSFTPGRFLAVPLSDRSAGNPAVGQNDGFSLSDAQLQISAVLHNPKGKPRLRLVLSFDGASKRYTDSLDTTGELQTVLENAYLQFNFKYGRLKIGRFKVAFDEEYRGAKGARQFVHAALESRGVKRGEGIMAGMQGQEPGRQLGLSYAVRPLKLGSGWYLSPLEIALTNGNATSTGGGQAAANENDGPAVFVRVEIGKKSPHRPRLLPFHVGLSGGFDERLKGAVGSRQLEQLWRLGADYHFNYSLFSSSGQVLFGRTRHLLYGGDTSNVEEDALGGHVQAGIDLLSSGFTAAYRYAYYDPTFSAVGSTPDFDRVTHHTVGLRYRLFAPSPAHIKKNHQATHHKLAYKSHPPMSHSISSSVLWLEYTHSGEQGIRAIANDRIELALQVSFR